MPGLLTCPRIHFFTPNKMLFYCNQLIWVFENHLISRCQRLFQPAFYSAEKNPWNEVAYLHKLDGIMHTHLPNKRNSPFTRAVLRNFAMFLLLVRLFAKRRFLVVISSSPLPLIRVGDSGTIFAPGTEWGGGEGRV